MILVLNVSRCDLIIASRSILKGEKWIATLKKINRHQIHKNNSYKAVILFDCLIFLIVGAKKKKKSTRNNLQIIICTMQIAYIGEKSIFYLDISMISAKCIFLKVQATYLNFYKYQWQHTSLQSAKKTSNYDMVFCLHLNCTCSIQELPCRGPII